MKFLILILTILPLQTFAVDDATLLGRAIACNNSPELQRHIQGISKLLPTSIAAYREYKDGINTNKLTPTQDPAISNLIKKYKALYLDLNHYNSEELIAASLCIYSADILPPSFSEKFRKFITEKAMVKTQFDFTLLKSGVKKVQELAYIAYYNFGGTLEVAGGVFIPSPGIVADYKKGYSNTRDQCRQRLNSGFECSWKEIALWIPTWGGPIFAAGKLFGPMGTKILLESSGHTAIVVASFSSGYLLGLGAEDIYQYVASEFRAGNLNLSKAEAQQKAIRTVIAFADEGFLD